MKILIGKNNESNRVDWLEKTLKNIPAGSRILDAGAGEQQFMRFCNHLKYVSQDFAEYDGLGDNKGLQTKTWDYGKLDIISDITAIPEQNESFDAIMCVEVFEHIIDPGTAISEFYRLLKKNGKLILTAPFCSLTHFAPYHYYSGFNKYFYEKILKEHGFNILEIQPNGNYFEYLSQEIRRIKTIAEKYANYRLNFLIKLLIKSLLFFLQKINNKEQGSAELLCFGYHILAEKK